MCVRQPRFTHVEKQRQTRRHAHGQVRHDRCPEVLHAGAPPFDEDEHPQDHRRDDDVHAEESAGRRGEQLIDEQPDVQSVIAKKRQELVERQHGAEDTQAGIHPLRVHRPRILQMPRLVALAIVTLLAAAPARAQIDPRGALLERTGWDAITAGQAHAAAEAFREAIAADPKNARLHLGAGMAASLERRDADAKDEFERALALDPKLTQARALLGQMQHRMGDGPGAIRTYELLLELAPDNRDAQATLDRWKREADLHDRMRQAVGSHFTVAFEGPAEAELASEALEYLDRAYWRIGQLLGTYPSDPIPVVLYTTEQFRDITRSPAWAAGSYDGVVIRVPMLGALDKREELDRVLSHEFTHALIRTLASRGVPAWLDEGLATALETGD